MDNNCSDCNAWTVFYLRRLWDFYFNNSTDNFSMTFDWKILYIIIRKYYIITSRRLLALSAELILCFCYIHFAEPARCSKIIAWHFGEMSWSCNYTTLQSIPLHWTQTNARPLSVHFEDEPLEHWQDVNRSQSHDNKINKQQHSIFSSSRVTNRAEVIGLSFRRTKKKVNLTS